MALAIMPTTSITPMPCMTASLAPMRRLRLSLYLRAIAIEGAPCASAGRPCADIIRAGRRRTSVSGRLGFGSDGVRDQGGQLHQRDHRVFDGDDAGKEVEPRALRDLGHRFDLGGVDRDDVRHAV